MIWPPSWDSGCRRQRDPVASVHAVLARYAAGWLLMFDNAPDMASVAEFLPPAGPGRVLITSQNSDLARDQRWTFPYSTPDVAADFLVSRTRDPDRHAAQELAPKLGGLPLALEQAAAYITAASGHPRRLPGLVPAAAGPTLLTRGVPTGYAETVATTWTLAFRQLEKSDRLRSACCGCWRSARPRQSRCRLMLQSSGGLIKQLGPDVAPRAGAAAGGPAGRR